MEISDTAKRLKCSSPFNACDEKDKVAIDLGAINKHLNVAGIYSWAIWSLPVPIPSHTEHHNKHEHTVL